MDPTPETSRRTRTALALVALAGFVAVLWASWLRWPDVNVDFGRELYAAWRVSEGDVLGRDLLWLNGPLSPWLNGVLFAVGGASLHLLVAANLVVLAITTLLALALHGRRGDAPLACLQALVIATVFACTQSARVGNYAWPTPYSHGLTHGLCLSLAALVLLARSSRAERGTGPALVAGLAAGAALLTKVEVGAALLPACTLALGMGVAPGGRRRRSLAFVLALAVPPLLAYARCRAELPADPSLEVVLGGWAHVGDERVTGLPFYRHMLGLDRPAENLRVMAVRGAGTLLGLGLLLGLARVLGTGLGVGRPGAAVRVLALVLGAGLATATLGLGSFEHPARPLPLFLLLGGLVSARSWARARRAGDPRRAAEQGLRLAAQLHALLLLARTGLAPTTVFYGFALALPGTLACVALLVHDLPAALARRGRAVPLARPVWAGAVLALGVLHVARSVPYWRSKDVEVGTGSDRFLAADRAPEVVAALDHLARTTGPDDRLLVLPEGALVPYLLRRPAALPVVTFMPPEVLIWGEAELLRRLQADPPERVVLVHKDTSEYGLGPFGRGYATSWMEWVRTTYEREVLFGALPLVSSGYGVSVLRARAER